MNNQTSSLEFSHFPVMLNEVLKISSPSTRKKFIDCTFGGGGYSKEILKLTAKNLIHSAAHITGGGLIENLTRSIPENLSLNVDLSKIKVNKIFKWLKSKNISDNEMMNTFNCGVGFCVISPKKNIVKIKNTFENKFKPYEIGFVSREKTKVKISNSLKW